METFVMTGSYRDEKGMVLVICLFMLLILSVIGASAIHTTVTDTRISGNVRDIRQGYLLARAGLNHGGEVLMENLSRWEAYQAGRTLIRQTDLGAGHYEVTIEDAGGEGRRRMRSTAKTKSGANAGMEAILSPDYSARDIPGLFGCEGVAVDGHATTQSYSSSGESTGGDRGHVGTSAPRAEVVLLGDALIHGDVYATGRIQMENNGLVLGSAYANNRMNLNDNTSVGGDAETGDVCLGCNGRVAGAVKEYATPLPVDVPGCDPLDLGNIFTGGAESIALDNNNAELRPAYYQSGDNRFFLGSTDTCILGAAGEQKQYYLSRLTLDAHARLTIHGQVSLFVDGDFSILGSAVMDLAPGAGLTVYVSGECFFDSNTQINNPGRPQDFKLYADNPSADADDFKMRLHSNTALAAVVYAPETAVQLNTEAGFFGSIRGKYVHVGSNTAFWYDEDLAGPMSQPAITGFDVVLKRMVD